MGWKPGRRRGPPKEDVKPKMTREERRARYLERAQKKDKTAWRARAKEKRDATLRARFPRVMEGR